jgi:hypothetical protein
VVFIIGVDALESGKHSKVLEEVSTILTSSREDSDMYVEHKAAVCQVQGANDIASEGGLPVILAPVDVWSARTTCTIENVGWSNSFKHFHDTFSVFHADRRLLDGLALAFEELVQMACDPTVATPDEERVWTVLNGLEDALVNAISSINLHLELLFIWNAQRAAWRE